MVRKISIRSAVFLAVLFIMLWSAPLAQAHVLVTDTTGKIGGVLHINPDDDPIAGQPSTLFFDIQNSTFSSHAHQVTVDITDDKGTSTSPSFSVTGSSVLITYTFPTQGVYTITLKADANEVTQVHNHTFIHTQRVTRGTTGSAIDTPQYAWAELLLIGGACSLAALTIVAVNRRTDIARYSVW